MRARAWAPRLPLPLRRAPRVLAARLAVVAFAAGVVFAARVALATGGEAFLEPRGRPGLRRPIPLRICDSDPHRPRPNERRSACCGRRSSPIAATPARTQ